MSNQVMLVSVQEDETRIALASNKKLVGLHMEQTHRERTVGNIYKGTIVKVNPAFQAAFVDYGEDRNGFLSLSDVNLALLGPNGGKGRPRIQSVLREGQTVMVQVIKEGLRNKGSALTTFVSLPGRYMVLSPNSERSGVSRKIEDGETRARLKDLLEALQAGENLGIIIRTAGIDQPFNELKRDLDGLRKQWRGIQDNFKKMKRPGQIYQEASPIVRVLRDYFTSDVEEVWVDDAEAFQEAHRYFKATLPRFQKRLKLYVGDISLFSNYGMEAQIEQLDSSNVPLKSGGSLVIESTEALVTVDVNSGRSSQGSDIEETALHTNLEAAQEVARQLRLRNLGGLVVIDFIDMMSAKSRRKVEDCLADAMHGDKARTTLGTISQFGLLELSRQRMDMETTRGLRVQCPTCTGTGHIPTVNAFANNVLRKIREMAATGRYSHIQGEVPLETASFLLNDKRESLRDLELEFDIGLSLQINPNISPGQPIELKGHRIKEGEELPEFEATSGAGEDDTDDSGKRRRRRRRRPRASGEELAAEKGFEIREEAAEAPQEDEALIDESAPDESRLEAEFYGLNGSASDDAEVEPEEDATQESSRHARGGRGGRGRRGRSDGDRNEAAGSDRDRKPREDARERDRVTEVDGSEAVMVAEKARDSQPTRKDSPKEAPASGVLFQSHHVITNPEALKKLPQARERSNPFAALGDNIAPDTVLFQSNNLELTVKTPEKPKVAKAEKSAAKATAGEPAEKEAPKSGGRRPRKPRDINRDSGTGEKASAASKVKTEAKSEAKVEGKAKAAPSAKAKSGAKTKAAPRSKAKETGKSAAKAVEDKKSTAAKPAGKSSGGRTAKGGSKAGRKPAGKSDSAA